MRKICGDGFLRLQKCKNRPGSGPGRILLGQDEMIPDLNFPAILMPSFNETHDDTATILD